MNILYLSHLSGSPYAGPTYSVPKQVQAQSIIDNVLWFNAVKNSPLGWKQLPYYYDLSVINKESIKELPSPFDKPDLIIVEGFYNMFKSKLIKELTFGRVPYIIIPRGELTDKAQERKKLKKKIANAIICNRFAKNAIAIQYLTRQEKNDSYHQWNKISFVMPNGIEMPQKRKNNFNNKSIEVISIGRIEPYQKGLDILIEASSQIKKELNSANCKISIYGPDSENQVERLKSEVKKHKLEGTVIFKGPKYSEDKIEALINSDIFIMPSRFEGHPMALIEALSLGLPVIVTTGSNMKEEIEENNAGWTSTNEVEGLKAALLEMINSQNLFESKGINAKKLAEKYVWSKLAQQSHDIFKKLLMEK